MTSNAKRPLAGARNNGLGRIAGAAALTALAAGFAFAAGHAMSGESRSWLESPSSWVALPVMIVLWGIALNRLLSSSRAGARARPEMLSRAHFLKDLRRERLRADRSGTSLSIALFSFPASVGQIAEARQFLAFLRAQVRDTDILGDLGDGRIGLLLTDTDQAGREAFLGKLVQARGGAPLPAQAATFPGQLFDRLAEENPDEPGASLFFLDAEGGGPPGYAAKRLLDIVGASTAILIFSPLMLFAAAAVKATSPGPVVFRQVRVGMDGRPFVFYKFRSMAWMADDSVHREYVASLIDGTAVSTALDGAGAPMYKLAADPRVTPVGRILRKTSIDELPQLFNVLKGEMSLVGPRPPLPYEAEKYRSWHLRRIFGVKPGMTGLWQVEGRCRTTFDAMVRLDLDYVDQVSLKLDLKILFKTVTAVVRGAGAA